AARWRDVATANPAAPATARTTATAVTLTVQRGPARCRPWSLMPNRSARSVQMVGGEASPGSRERVEMDQVGLRQLLPRGIVRAVDRARSWVAGRVVPALGGPAASRRW